MSDCDPSMKQSVWPDHRAVWRWHFYAGLITLPFVIVLSVSGAIYLFKPQIEAWNDRARDHLTISGKPAPMSEQVQAALAAFPGSGLNSFELPASPQSATRVLVSHENRTIRVYVHPETLQILHSIPDDERLMRVLFRLHGELLMGPRGSHVVEMAASWTIIMILTGLYLWWPRQVRGIAGVVYPRLRMGRGIFWRDIHSVTGLWISGFALFLLVSGLPWAKFWGDYFKDLRRLTGTAVVQQDWANGSDRSPLNGALKSIGGEHSGHAVSGAGNQRGGSGGRRRGGVPMPEDLPAFDRIVNSVQPLGLDHPVTISPPSSTSSVEWSVKSMTPNRPRRVNLVLDGRTGEVLSREGFQDRHWIDRLVGYGIAAHEGQLFGWLNQLIGLLTAVGLVLLSVSSVIMWWRRRDQGVLGAPRALAAPRLAPGLVLIVVILGVYLPLFGLSLLFVLAVETVILRQIPAVSRWLGLNAPEVRIA